MKRANSFDLALLWVGAVIELGVTAFAAAAFTEVADASVFGRDGTVAVDIAGVLIVSVGAILGWRGARPRVLITTAVCLFVVVGLAALMAVYFVIGGGTPIIFAVLLTHAAVSAALIGRAVLRSVPTGKGD